MQSKENLATLIPESEVEKARRCGQRYKFRIEFLTNVVYMIKKQEFV
jgi:hypothetical protein